jgi:hypothetical protein
MLRTRGAGLAEEMVRVSFSKLKTNVRWRGMVEDTVGCVVKSGGSLIASLYPWSDEAANLKIGGEWWQHMLAGGWAEKCGLQAARLA